MLFRGMNGCTGHLGLHNLHRRRDLGQLVFGHDVNGSNHFVANNSAGDIGQGFLCSDFVLIQTDAL